MNDEVGSRVFMSIDLKKYCIRIHKACLHLIGDPKYIQILVNLDDMAVVIRSVDHTLRGGSDTQSQSDTVQIYKLSRDL